MSFKKEHLSQTELGQIFGVSSHVIGNWLVDIGLRTQKKRPSSYAHSEEYIQTLSNGSWGYRYVWNAEKTVAALIEAGHYPISPPPGELVKHSVLKGPFTSRVNNSGTHEIVGDDGFPVAWVLGEHNAKAMTKLMNLAHEHGVFDRIKPPPPLSESERVETDGFVVVS